MSQRIAIVGAGISGLTAAWYLSRDHQVDVFEANDYLGGHTCTVPVSREHGDYAIDVGFIVFNDRTYPNYLRLLDELGLRRWYLPSATSATDWSIPVMGWAGFLPRSAIF